MIAPVVEPPRDPSPVSTLWHEAQARGRTDPSEAALAAETSSAIFGVSICNLVVADAQLEHADELRVARLTARSGS
jgi:hypothetical protein